MFYINHGNTQTCGNGDGDTSRERKRLTEERLTEELAGILNRSCGGKAYWKGSTTDLMEVVYTAYMSGSIYDEKGQPCSFKQLVHETCRTLHVSEPANPRSYIYRAQNRKGIRQEPFIQRYGRMLSGQNGGCPLETMLKRR